MGLEEKLYIKIKSTSIPPKAPPETMPRLSFNISDGKWPN
jgi:hypothetical protein